ncbi:acyl-CoA thioesterase [bacterium]|nr:MAG: acyl-CoA thioesterase [bacterium]
MKDYPISVKEEVRWRDADALGHVNNAVYLTYFEMARVAFLKALYGTLTMEAVNFVLASVTCEYISPVFVGDSIEIGIKVVEVGRTSFDFEYMIVHAQEGFPIAKGRSTQVFYDFQESRKMPIPEGWIESVEEISGEKIRRKQVPAAES